MNGKSPARRVSHDDQLDLIANIAARLHGIEDAKSLSEAQSYASRALRLLNRLVGQVRREPNPSRYLAHRRRSNHNPWLMINPAGGKRLADAVYSIAYRHADDGADYEHEFESPNAVRLVAQGDRRVVLVSRSIDIVGEFDV